MSRASHSDFSRLVGKQFSDRIATSWKCRFRWEISDECFDSESGSRPRLFVRKATANRWPKTRCSSSGLSRSSKVGTGVRSAPGHFRRRGFTLVSGRGPIARRRIRIEQECFTSTSSSSRTDKARSSRADQVDIAVAVNINGGHLQAGAGGPGGKSLSARRSSFFAGAFLAGSPWKITCRTQLFDCGLKSYQAITEPSSDARLHPRARTLACR